MWFDAIKRKVTKEEFERRGREILGMRFHLVKQIKKEQKLFSMIF